MLNQVATAEQWDEVNKRRVAIGKQVGVAAHWYDQSDHVFNTWLGWIAHLRATFEPQISLADWCLMVESRRQAPGESGAQYAFEKSRLCHRCPLQITEAEIVPYLARGNMRSEHASVLMNPVPSPEL